MEIPRIEVSQALRGQYPELVVSWFGARGFGRFRGLDVDGIVRRSQAKWERAGLTGEAIGRHPALSPWRAAFARQGVKPAKYRSSVEALVRRFGSSSYRLVGIPIVDLYNALSAFYEISMGAYDLDRVGTGNIILRFDEPGDEFIPLGASADDYFFNRRIPVYASGNHVLAWCFNHRDSRETSIRNDTAEILFVSESISACQLDNHKRAVDELQRSLAIPGVELTPVSWLS